MFRQFHHRSKLSCEIQHKANETENHNEAEIIVIPLNLFCFFFVHKFERHPEALVLSRNGKCFFAHFCPSITRGVQKAVVIGGRALVRPDGPRSLGDSASAKFATRRYRAITNALQSRYTSLCNGFFMRM